MDARFQQQRQRRSSISLVTLLLFVALLLFPSLAGLRLTRSFDARFMFGYLVAISGLTFWLYWNDKRRAKTDSWRTPESTLHLAELLGGWPAAFLAQRTFRHKISKTSYQVVFWMIVALHEAVSFDLLSEWHYSQAAIRLLQQ
jgi:uncharacterized membrane protein YsdA (DUF1294 family)